MLDLNDKVGSPCKLTGEWGFVGYLKNGTAVPIGTYSTYRDGAAHANSWLHATPNAIRWEGQRLFEPLTSEGVMEA